MNKKRYMNVRYEDTGKNLSTKTQRCERKVRRPASVSKDENWYENNTRIGRVDHEFDFDFEYVVVPLWDWFLPLKSYLPAP